jgi:hypothetical protein
LERLEQAVMASYGTPQRLHPCDVSIWITRNFWSPDAEGDSLGDLKVAEAQDSDCIEQSGRRYGETTTRCCDLEMLEISDADSAMKLNAWSALLYLLLM